MSADRTLLCVQGIRRRLAECRGRAGLCMSYVLERTGRYGLWSIFSVVLSLILITIRPRLFLVADLDIHRIRAYRLIAPNFDEYTSVVIAN